MMETMARVTLTMMAVLLAAGATGQMIEPQVAEIQVRSSDGPALVGLARSAMVEFLANRTPVERQAIPDNLKHLELDKRTYAAAVTLRHEGQTVGRAIKNVSVKNDRGLLQPASVCRNVIAAALEAMRSEQLPDRVTRAYIDSLTVEVEILSPPAAVEPPPGQPLSGPLVERLIHPGRTGLRVSRGAETGTLLPSDGYTLGLDAAGIRQASQASVPQSPANADMDWRYWLLESRHFVGYGDATPGLAGRVLCLTRGKTLLPDMQATPEAVAEEIAKTLPRVAAHLLTNQTEDGLYAIGQTATPLRDHLAAACAMLRAGQRLRSDELIASGMKGLDYAVRLCHREDGKAYVQTAPTDQYGATAMLAHAISLVPHRNEQSEALYGELIRALLAGIGKDGWPLARLDGEPSKTKAPLRDALLAYMVLFGGAATPEEASAYGAMEQALTAATPTTPTEALWRLRVGLPPAIATPTPQPQPDPLPFVSQVLPSQGRDDELGGFAFGRQPASVELTALALTVQSAGQGWSGQPLQADPDKRTAQLAAMTTWAQSFVYTMMYSAHEAYFSKDPATWQGAVRVDAGSARATPAAAAAAIEILLMETVP
jgi:AMMECR1 domain-containing protein